MKYIYIYFTCKILRFYISKYKKEFSITLYNVGIKLCFFLFQKLKNSIKSDLVEKCLKCNEVDCDCFVTEDENPELVMQPLDIKQYENFSIAPPYNSSFQILNNITNQNVQQKVVNPSDTLSQYDNIH